MIAIRTNLVRNLDTLAQQHYQLLKPTILSRLPALRVRQRDFITLHLERILTAKPDDLAIVNQEFIAYCTRAGSQHRLTLNSSLMGLQGAFNYKHFTQTNATHYCGYDLAKALNVTTCPYCNRNYTVTIARKKRVTRPDFDHFLPKKKYPLLNLSFYNLIPSCLVCNRSVKNQANVVYGEYIHPYEDGFETAAKFSHLPLDADSAVGLGTKFSINLTLNPIEVIKSRKCAKSFELFQIKEIYEESHGGEIADIVRKYHISSGRYLEVLHSAFPQLGTLEELYRVAFGNYYHEDEFSNRPLSKLTKDVVDQMVFLDPLLR